MNQKNIKRNYFALISIISMLFIVNGQSYSQWQNTDLPSSSTVNTLAIIDSILFAGTNGDGIFVSTDNGETWNSKNTGLQNKVIRTIFIDSTYMAEGKLRIFAGTETGASVSTDYGESWTTVNSGLSGEGIWSFAVSKIVPESPKLFAGTWSGLLSFSESDTSWKTVGFPHVIMPVNSVLVNKSFIYAATAGSGLFVSKNNGSSWYQYPLLNIEVVHTSIDTGIIPIYSMGKINSNVVIGMEFGYIDYMPNDKNIFISSHSYPYRPKPIMSFYERDGILYGGTIGGDILLTKTFGYDWELLTPTLTYHAIYSVLLNSAYIFAGIENGVWRLSYPETTTNADNFKEIPTGFALEQNYPNPFNSSTKIRFTIPKNTFVSLKVYNILGELVKDLVNGNKSAGTYEVDFSPVNLQSGIYFYSLTTNEFRNIKKLILLK